MTFAISFAERWSGNPSPFDTLAARIASMDVFAMRRRAPQPRNQRKAINHEANPEWNVGGNRLVRAAVGLCDKRHARHQLIGCLQIDGELAAGVVFESRRMWLQRRRTAGDMLARRDVSQLGRLPARGAVAKKRPPRLWQTPPAFATALPPEGEQFAPRGGPSALTFRRSPEF